MTSCTYCGRPDADVFQTVSRHRTVHGETVWTRCSCASLQVRLADDTGERVISRGRPAAAQRELAVAG